MMRESMIVAVGVALGVIGGIVSAMLFGPLDDTWGVVGIGVIIALVVIFQVQRRVNDRS